MDNHPMQTGPASDFALDLHTDIGGLVLNNPVMTASGTFGYGAEFDDLVDLKRLGAIVVKGISLKPSAGNPPPRIVETPSGMLNAIGLENVGIDCFVEQKLPFLDRVGVPVIVNIYGQSVAEYAQLAGLIDALDSVAAMEVNISCPNVSAGGIAFGVDAAAAASVVQAVRDRTTKPVMVKLSPNVTDVVAVAESCQSAGAHSLSLINTLTGLAIDIERRQPILANITGGLSGPAIRPVALRMVWQVAAAVDIPVIGIGGICSAADALEFLIAGAAAIQVGTANFINPRATTDILDGVISYMQRHGFTSLHELIGSLELGS